MIELTTYKDGKFYYGDEEISVPDMLDRLNKLEHQNAIMCQEEMSYAFKMWFMRHQPDWNRDRSIEYYGTPKELRD